MINRGWLKHGIHRVLRRALVRLAGLIISWRRRRRDRRLLASLTERELRDLGIDRTMIKNDTAVEFWRWR